MNRTRRQYLYVALAIVAVGVLISVTGDKGDFLMWLARHRHPAWDHYFYYVTQLGEPIGFVVIGLWLWWSSWRKMIFVPILGGAATLVAYLLKRFFEHERPVLFLNRIGWDGPMNVLDYHMHTGHKSFPSGHSMAAWALFGYLALVGNRPWLNALCLVLAVSVSVSRVYLMVHFLQDVVAGSAIGLALAVGAWYLHERWSERSPKPRAKAPEPGRS